MEKELLASLSFIRPILHADGGDIELIEIKDDCTVVLRLMGKCKQCPKAGSTLKGIVEKTIYKMIPQVKNIEIVA